MMKRDIFMIPFSLEDITDVDISGVDNDNVMACEYF